MERFVSHRASVVMMGLLNTVSMGLGEPSARAVSLPIMQKLFANNLGSLKVGLITDILLYFHTFTHFANCLSTALGAVILSNVQSLVPVQNLNLMCSGQEDNLAECQFSSLSQGCVEDFFNRAATRCQGQSCTIISFIHYLCHHCAYITHVYYSSSRVPGWISASDWRGQRERRKLGDMFQSSVGLSLP